MDGALTTLGDDGVEVRVLQPFPVAEDLVVGPGTGQLRRRAGNVDLPRRRRRLLCHFGGDHRSRSGQSQLLSKP